MTDDRTPPTRPLALITGASAGHRARRSPGPMRRGATTWRWWPGGPTGWRRWRPSCAPAHGIEAFAIPADLAGFEAHAAGAGGGGGARAATSTCWSTTPASRIAQSFAGVPWERQRDFLMTLVVNACGLATAVIPGMVERGGGRDHQRRLAGGASRRASPATASIPAAKSLTREVQPVAGRRATATGASGDGRLPGLHPAPNSPRPTAPRRSWTQAPRRFFQTAEQVVEATHPRQRAAARSWSCPAGTTSSPPALLRYTARAARRSPILAARLGEVSSGGREAACAHFDVVIIGSGAGGGDARPAAGADAASRS